MSAGQASMLNRPFPTQADNSFAGHRAALRLLALLTRNRKGRTL